MLCGICAIIAVGSLGLYAALTLEAWSDYATLCNDKYEDDAVSVCIATIETGFTTMKILASILYTIALLFAVSHRMIHGIWPWHVIYVWHWRRQRRIWDTWGRPRDWRAGLE